MNDPKQKELVRIDEEPVLLCKLEMSLGDSNIYIDAKIVSYGSKSKLVEIYLHWTNITVEDL